MRITSQYIKFIVILLIGWFFSNQAQAEALFGLTLLKSNVEDVQNLITQSGANITEDSPLYNSGSRVIRIQGGSFPGAPVYISGNFSFDNNGRLFRYNILRSLNTPDALGGYNNRLQALSAGFKTYSQTGSTIRFMAPDAIISLTVDRNKNQFIEDWQQSSNTGNDHAVNKGAAIGDRWQIAAQCAKECPIGSCNTYPSGLGNYDATMNAACQQKMNQCMQECVEEYANGRQ